MVPIEPILYHKIEEVIEGGGGDQPGKHLFPSFDLFRGGDQLKAIYLDPKDFKRLRTQEKKNSGKNIFLNLIFSNFNTGQMSHLNTIQ